MRPNSPCLGVHASWTGRLWQLRTADARITEALCQRFNLPEAVAHSLSARGITLQTAHAFLDPTLRHWLPDPSTLRDMNQAVARVQAALRNGEMVALWGDYDVDGATSAALLIRFWRALGMPDPILYVPDRQREGYGPNASGLHRLATQGVTLTLCLDCGTMAHDALKHAAQAGMDIIVLDHHQAEATLPHCVALVNPNRLDEPRDNPCTRLAAVGVAYLFIIALNRALRGEDWYAERGIEEPDMRQWLDLVAVGTVCDVMPLVGLNRAFVRQGLRVLGQGLNLGLGALARLAGLTEHPSTGTIGFVLGPRLNAGGRVGTPDMGARILTTDDPDEAMALAQQLQVVNAQRQTIETAVLDDAMARADALMQTENPPILVVASTGWHSGVIGIVAARLREAFNRPTFVLAIDDSTNVAKGSGRSTPEVDLGALVLAARQAGVIDGGGGHAMAAGVTVAPSAVDAFRAFACAHARDIPIPERRPLTIDGVLSVPAACDPAVLEGLNALEPFGVGNPEPRVALASCRIVKRSVVGKDQNHVNLILSQGGKSLRAIAFRAMESDLGTALLSTGERPCHLVGTLRHNTWNGTRTVQLVIEDGMEK